MLLSRGHIFILRHRTKYYLHKKILLKLIKRKQNLKSFTMILNALHILINHTILILEYCQTVRPSSNAHPLKETMFGIQIDFSL